MHCFTSLEGAPGARLLLSAWRSQPNHQPGGSQPSHLWLRELLQQAAAHDFISHYQQHRRPGLQCCCLVCVTSSGAAAWKSEADQVNRAACMNRVAASIPSSTCMAIQQGQQKNGTAAQGRSSNGKSNQPTWGCVGSPPPCVSCTTVVLAMRCNAAAH